jgi:hypothetical protein
MEKTESGVSEVLTKALNLLKDKLLSLAEKLSRPGKV